MKRFNISFLFLFAALLIGIGCFAKDKDKALPGKVYMFGFSASFSDSLVYITDIQDVDSAIIEPKTEFLVNRSAYGNQLQFFLTEKMNRPNTTCVVFFHKKKDELQKKYNKILKRYKNSNQTIVKTLSRDEFRFTPEINRIVSE